MLSPFGDEINECLRLDGGLWLEVDGMLPELDGPFSDSSGGIPILEDVTEGELSDHLYGVGLEVMLELLGGDDDGSQKLLHLGILDLRRP
ncbi:hypothetical protein GUJ93_ZPchr0015g6904 [Zizania palustris]|uniref:Uncharacterized protein n=1 Tax=Zizania palustris TaxID=103762 RepID=A0A8J5TLX3_ZIZPA|nr:hypothetical protein GUJ93_ZPchr0015g6904 [Zizania palustris]